MKLGIVRLSLAAAFPWMCFQAMADCAGPNGTTVLSGDSVHLFRYEYAPEGKICEGIDRECKGGDLEGDGRYVYESCSTEKKCVSSLGEVVPPGGRMPAYAMESAPCTREIRVCNGKTGKLSGSFEYQSCRDR